MQMALVSIVRTKGSPMGGTVAVLKRVVLSMAVTIGSLAACLVS